MKAELKHDDLVELGKMYLAGRPMVEIAEAFDLHHQTIRTLVKKLELPSRSRGRWKAAQPASIAAAKHTLAQQVLKGNK